METKEGQRAIYRVARRRADAIFIATTGKVLGTEERPIFLFCGFREGLRSNPE